MPPRGKTNLKVAAEVFPDAGTDLVFVAILLGALTVALGGGYCFYLSAVQPCADSKTKFIQRAKPKAR